MQILQSRPTRVEPQQLELVRLQTQSFVFSRLIWNLCQCAQFVGCMCGQAREGTEAGLCLQVKQTVWSWVRGAGQNSIPAFLKNKIAQNAACLLQVDPISTEISLLSGSTDHHSACGN